MKSNNRSALFGFLFAVPFIVANFVVVLHLEPLYSFLGSFPLLKNSAFMPLFLLLLFPVGAFIAIRPVLQKGVDGKRQWYMLNILMPTLLLASFALIFTAFAEDIYNCDILRIPNCD